MSGVHMCLNITLNGKKGVLEHLLLCCVEPPFKYYKTTFAFIYILEMKYLCKYLCNILRKYLRKKKIFT